WWGITPGKTTWIEAQRLLSLLDTGIIENYEIKDNGAIHKVFFPALRTDLSLFRFDMTFDLFVAKDGVVQWINAQSDNYNYRVDKEAIDFVMLWNHYSPQQVLKDYGLPSNVALFVDEGGELYDPHAEIWLLYEEKGLLFIYRGKAMGFRKQDEFFYRVCPLWGNGLMDPFIGIYLRAADNPLPLSRLIYPDVGEPYFSTFTDATGVSIENFRNSMLQKDKTICFDTPREIWESK
ncbi:MAG: hypothetical protein HY740_05175, partial [Chloroflexi bacterium]|nr:hypothetical protein [Chloroflexota bacterium]